MTRITPRFLPTARLLRPATPETQPLYYDYVSDQLRGVGFLPPGQLSGVRFTTLSDEFEDFDGVPGLPSKLKASALHLDYQAEWTPTQASQWSRQVSPQEKDWRDLDRLTFTTRIGQIDEALKDAKDKTKTELEDEKRDAQSILDQLNTGGSGYLRTAPGTMDTRVDGIFWGLAAPNVPVKLTSVFTLDRDRILSFAYKRHAPHKEQAQFRYIVGFGNGFTQYALSIGDDGNSTEFWHFRNMSEGARQKLLDQLETLLDFGRLTVADRKQLLEWETEERSIRAKAKKDGEKLTDAESSEIEALKKRADELKKSKRLTARQDQQVKALENKIFLAQETFKLQEESSNLINKRVDVSVQFLRSGYIIVRSGTTEFRYENKRITGLSPQQFHFGLPEKSRLSIQSDGGKWSFVVGRPRWKETALVLTQPFASKNALDPADFTARIVGDLLQGQGTESGKPWDYGCSATAELIELKAPSGIQSGLYQVQITLQSDGRYTPEIYYVGLHRAASMVTGGGQEVWNSEDAANRRDGKNRIIDVLLQDDKRRSRQAKLIVANGRNGAHLPPRCDALACDISLMDRWNEGALVTLIRHGYILRDEADRIGSLETATGFATVPLHGSERVFAVNSCEGFLNRPMAALVPSDGMFPNDYVRQCCRDAGLPASLWSRIPAGDAGYARISPTRPGRYPHSKPSQGTTYLEEIHSTVSAHCHGAQFWSDGQGMRLDKFAVRDRPELAFGTPSTGVSVESPLCLRDGFKLVQDLSDYLTTASVIGAKDPATGQRFSATESIPQASDPAFQDSLYYIGHDIPYLTGSDESLNNRAACLWAARDILHITPQTPNGLAPYFGAAVIDLDPTLLSGDMVRVFGLKMIVDSLELGGLASEEGQKLKASLQLCEDRRPPEGL